VEAVPLKLEFCYTSLARGIEYREICYRYGHSVSSALRKLSTQPSTHYSRFKAMSSKFGTVVREEKGRLVFDLV
jgi:hypothetical protein